MAADAQHPATPRAGTLVGPLTGSVDASRRQHRWRLAALWTSQSARAAADACLRLFIVLLAAGGSAGQRESAWHLVMALFMLPCLLLAPVNGAIGNSLPKRGVLVASAAWCLAMALVFGTLGHGWLGGMPMVAMVALGAAVYVPTRFALLPAAAQDCGLPLVRVVSWIEAGAVLSTVAGMVIAGELARAAPLPIVWADAAGVAQAGVPATLLAIWTLGLLSLLAALPSRFESDRPRPEPPLAALHGFFLDLRRIAADRAALAALLGLAAFRGIVAVAVGALIAMVMSRETGDPEAAYRALLTVAMLSMLGAAIGSLLAGLQRDRQRALWLVPVGASGLALALAWVAWVSAVPLLLCVAVGTLGGLMNVPMIVAYQTAVPADARGNGMAILNTAGYFCITLLSLAMAGLSAAQVLSATGQLACVSGLAAIGAAVAWRLVFGRGPVAAVRP